MKCVFTSESVTEGHPDKICDLIADTILDNALAQDSDSKMAVEATIKDDFVLIYGEANTKADINYEKIALNVLQEIGYKEKYEVLVKVNKQSMEISNAVTKEDKSHVGAGDQGIMFGYACDDTEVYMPAPIYYANLLAKRLSTIQKKYEFLGPDGKTQVSVHYNDDNIIRIDTIVISTQHSKDKCQKELHSLIKKEVIDPIIPKNLLDGKTKYYVNPSGSFIVGGSFGDSGTTGRKIVCDTYGGMGRVGGGCLSSKDPSKVDRSAAYYCRYVAKNVVAHGLAKKCEIQVSYMIGHETPVSIYVNTFGTERIELVKIYDYINNNFDFAVGNIIQELDLKKPIYSKTSCYGHFGRNEFSWERIK